MVTQPDDSASEGPVTADTTKPQVESYARWLAGEMIEEPIVDGQISEITLPFLDRHNDHLQVYVLLYGNRDIRIDDDGESVRDLGHAIGDRWAESDATRDLAARCIRGIPDVQLKGRSVSARCDSPEEFPEKLHAVIMAKLAIDGMARARAMEARP